jgi:hypothetical protein
MCCGKEVKWAFVNIREFLPACRQRQSRATNVWVRLFTQRALHFYFLRKWRKDSSSGIESNFARSLTIVKWKPFWRFSGVSATMPWASHKLRSGTTDSKMAALRLRLTLVPVGSQQADMMISLTKCRLCSCKIVVSPSKNLRRGWG